MVLAPMSALADEPAEPEDEELAITTEKLADGVVGEEYSETLEADGAEKIVWDIDDGDLPDGLLLDKDTGKISGTPEKAGTFEFTVIAEDDDDEDNYDTLELSIKIWPELSIPTERLAGKDRIETAIEIAKEGWTEAQSVVLADSRSFPDALTGGPLAFLLDAPILLTKGDESRLRDDVKDLIEELDAKNIYILGGTAAVSAAIFDELKDSKTDDVADYDVLRLGGADRYETAVAIAQKMDELRGVNPGRIFVVDGITFADALSVAPVASILSAPILLTPSGKTGFVAASFAYADSCGAKTACIVGGTSAVSASVETRLTSIGYSFERASGDNRYATSAEVYKKFKGLFTGGVALLANGRNFPDALGGGALGAKLRAPLLLIDGEAKTSSSAVAGALVDFAPDKVYILGGESAVSDMAVRYHIQPKAA